MSGWQRRAWLDGDWDIAAGQFFTNFRREVHVVEDFDDLRAREWFAAMDYGYAHYTVVLLGCKDGEDDKDSAYHFGDPALGLIPDLKFHSFDPLLS